MIAKQTQQEILFGSVFFLFGRKSHSLPETNTKEQKTTKTDTYTSSIWSTLFYI